MTPRGPEQEVGVSRERLLRPPGARSKASPGPGGSALTPATLSFPVVNCSDPGLVDNAVRPGQQGPADAFVYGQSVLFRCKRGFYLLGSSALTCTASGSWDRSLPRCLGECGSRGLVTRALGQHQRASAFVSKC